MHRKRLPYMNAEPVFRSSLEIAELYGPAQQRWFGSGDRGDGVHRGSPPRNGRVTRAGRETDRVSL